MSSTWNVFRSLGIHAKGRERERGVKVTQAFLIARSNDYSTTLTFTFSYSTISTNTIQDFNLHIPYYKQMQWWLTFQQTHAVMQHLPALLQPQNLLSLLIHLFHHRFFDIWATKLINMVKLDHDSFRANGKILCYCKQDGILRTVCTAK